MDFEPGDRIQLIRSDEAAFVRQLKAETGKPIWLCGGGEFEPFLYHYGVFLQEIRSQTGIRWQQLPRSRLELVYFNRWIIFPGTILRWQHAGVPSTVALVGENN